MITGMEVTEYLVILWELDILSTPISQSIPPRDPDSKDDELDNILPPIDLHQHQATDCDCFN